MSDPRGGEPLNVVKREVALPALPGRVPGEGRGGQYVGDGHLSSHACELHVGYVREAQHRLAATRLHGGLVPLVPEVAGLRPEVGPRRAVRRAFQNCRSHVFAVHVVMERDPAELLSRRDGLLQIEHLVPIRSRRLDKHVAAAGRRIAGSSGSAWSTSGPEDEGQATRGTGGPPIEARLEPACEGGDLHSGRRTGRCSGSACWEGLIRHDVRLCSLRIRLRIPTARSRQADGALRIWVRAVPGTT